jgi:thioredoxin-related protein
MKRPHAAFALLLPLLLLVAGLSAPHAAPTAAPAWRAWDEGLKEAARLKRPVLVDVYTDWCGWCKRMDRDVYARADVRDYLARRFVVVKLNAESPARVRWEGREMTSRALASRLGVTGYPNTTFLDAAGRKLGSVPGYVPAPKFLQVLRSVAEDQAGRAGRAGAAR